MLRTTWSLSNSATQVADGIAHATIRISSAVEDASSDTIRRVPRPWIAANASIADVVAIAATFVVLTLAWVLVLALLHRLKRWKRQRPVDPLTNHRQLWVDLGIMRERQAPHLACVFTASHVSLPSLGPLPQ